MSRARIVTDLEELYAVADLAQAGFDVAGPRWKNRATRLGSSRRAVADHWLLEHEGRPVSALLCYPLTFALPDGAVAQGFGLGAVTTRPDARCQGHAAALCVAAAEHAARQGRTVGLLFSGIAPRYYERLGYHTCAAWSPVTEKLEALAASGTCPELSPIDPRRGRSTLSNLYAQHHRGMLHLHRDDAAWQRTFTAASEDLWFAVGPPAAPRGYVRCAVHRLVLDVIELVLTDAQDEAPVLRTLAAMAAELDLQKMGAWIPMSPFVRQWFEDTGREHTLPMVCGIAAAGPSQFWGSDYF